jgi:hypothetical protein
MSNTVFIPRKREDIKFRVWHVHEQQMHYLSNVDHLEQTGILDQFEGCDNPDNIWMQLAFQDEDIALYEGDIINVCVQANDWTKEHFHIEQDGWYKAIITFDEDFVGFHYNYLPLQDGILGDTFPNLTNFALPDLLYTIPNVKGR